MLIVVYLKRPTFDIDMILYVRKYKDVASGCVVIDFFFLTIKDETMRRAINSISMALLTGNIYTFKISLANYVDVCGF